jgi:hypothetical protein
LWFDQRDVPLKRFFRHDWFDLCHEAKSHGQCKAVKEPGHHPSLQAIPSIWTERHFITIFAKEDCPCLIDSFSSVRSISQMQ